MGKRKEISVIVNYPSDEDSIKELNNKKAGIIINVLKERYGEMALEKYINSIKEIKDDYS